jgi:hypothetical protein
MGKLYTFCHLPFAFPIRLPFFSGPRDVPIASVHVSRTLRFALPHSSTDEAPVDARQLVDVVRAAIRVDSGRLGLLAEPNRVRGSGGV